MSRPASPVLVLVCPLVALLIAAPPAAPIPEEGPGGGDAEVPLELWRGPGFLNGIPMGPTTGLAWLDFDADGFVDIFSFRSGELWRNVNGTTWELADDLDSILPESDRYGSSAGDYNNDGYPDIATEPRHSDSLHLLENLQGTSFVDVAPDPQTIDVRPWGSSETLCWGDVDGDGFLDLFVPVYPEWAGGPGNFFLSSLGPTGAGGAYRFRERSEEVGLDNPPGTSRPEGAQFVDVDADGDLDLFSNGTLYQNRSALAAPLFGAMSEEASGIGLRAELDEGAAFFDYDLDGDYDLAIVYTGPGVRLWENAGDGTFFAPDPEMIEDRFTGLNLGLSAEDWDNDGDVDFTTRQVFRRNLLMEEGVRRFEVASTAIPDGHLTAAMPSWADWDLDGDLDCALGNRHQLGHFYENVLYDAEPAAAERRHVRVRVVRDSPAVPAGLETEYGASVEVVLRGAAADGTRRKKFVASGHGYLNQNEYALHFALPADPAPADPGEDVRFDLVVDFPGLPEFGLWRVDRSVNPALGNVNLADLSDREIRVYRSGRVVLDGVSYDPAPGANPRLATTAGGLVLAAPDEPLADLTPTWNWYVGLAFHTMSATEPLLMKEILLDGQLDVPVTVCGETFNVALWDLTDPAAPEIVAALVEETSERNRRSSFLTDIELEPGREYRLIARVTSFRPTPIRAPLRTGPIEITGGLGFRNSEPCGDFLSSLQPLPIRTSLVFRFPSAPDAATSAPAETASLFPGPGGRLLAARPNPFRASAVLPFSLDAAGRVHVNVYDVAGRRVRALGPGLADAGAGQVIWDGRDEAGAAVASGVYFYELRVDDAPRDQRKLVLKR